MTPAKRAALQAAADHVSRQLAAGLDAGTVIAELVGQHGATFRSHTGTNELRCAGVSTSCTWSKDKGLLDGWRRNATVSLMQAGS